jgi:hypothetical protein
VHEGAGFAWLAFALCRLHGNASSEHLVNLIQPQSPFTRFSPSFHPTQATFFALFFSFLLQVSLLGIDSLPLAILPPQTKQKKENDENT